jgi:hypothetical protein
VDWIIAFGTNLSSPRVNTVPELALAENVTVTARTTETTIARSFRIGVPFIADTEDSAGRLRRHWM